VRHKSITNLISHGIISLYFVRSENNIADPLTKRLTRQQVFESSRGMRLDLVTIMDIRLRVIDDPMNRVQ